jgi:hypothetical protein
VAVVYPEVTQWWYVHDVRGHHQKLLIARASYCVHSFLYSTIILQVMDELKVLQLQVNDRPSTSDVSNMMEGISHTFRK